jgi:hypothetical protein
MVPGATCPEQDSYRIAVVRVIRLGRQDRRVVARRRRIEPWRKIASRRWASATDEVLPVVLTHDLERGVVARPLEGRHVEFKLGDGARTAEQTAKKAHASAIPPRSGLATGLPLQ